MFWKNLWPTLITGAQLPDRSCMAHQHWCALNMAGMTRCRNASVSSKQASDWCQFLASFPNSLKPVQIEVFQILKFLVCFSWSRLSDFVRSGYCHVRYTKLKKLNSNILPGVQKMSVYHKRTNLTNGLFFRHSEGRVVFYNCHRE